MNDKDVLFCMNGEETLSFSIVSCPLYYLLAVSPKTPTLSAVFISSFIFGIFLLLNLMTC